MTIRYQLMRAQQDDAQRSGERDRLLLEVRRARGGRRHRPDPAALAMRLARLSFRWATAVPRNFPLSSGSPVPTSLSPGQHHLNDGISSGH